MDFKISNREKTQKIVKCMGQEEETLFIQKEGSHRNRSRHTKFVVSFLWVYESFPNEIIHWDNSDFYNVSVYWETSTNIWICLCTEKDRYLSLNAEKDNEVFRKSFIMNVLITISCVSFFCIEIPNWPTGLRTLVRSITTSYRFYGQDNRRVEQFTYPVDQRHTTTSHS